MEDEPRITLTDAPEPEATAAISDGLAAYNDAMADSPSDARPLAVVVQDPASGRPLGGLYGRSYRGTVFIDRFFLPETLRRGGLGSRLLAMAEEEGRRRGCGLIALFTLHFQAPGFYLKQGYTEAARLEPPSPGATRFLMTKTLLPSPR
jgi:GNAT superfamily N-acetyltransferase